MTSDIAVAVASVVTAVAVTLTLLRQVLSDRKRDAERRRARIEVRVTWFTGYGATPGLYLEVENKGPRRARSVRFAVSAVTGPETVRFLVWEEDPKGFDLEAGSVRHFAVRDHVARKDAMTNESKPEALVRWDDDAGSQTQRFVLTMPAGY